MARPEGEAPGRPGASSGPGAPSARNAILMGDEPGASLRTSAAAGSGAVQLSGRTEQALIEPIELCAQVDLEEAVGAPVDPAVEPEDPGAAGADGAPGAAGAAVDPEDPGAAGAAVDLGESVVALPQRAIQMVFVDVVVRLPSTHPVVVLEERASTRRQLRIPVGGAEGIAIAYAARGIETAKPLTHQLIVDLLEAFTLTPEVLRVTKVAHDSFFAELVVSGPQGMRVLPCRPSDGIALALRSRLPVPITASEEVLDAVGVQPAPGAVLPPRTHPCAPRPSTGKERPWTAEGGASWGGNGEG